jgi:hypothetical protein
MIFSTLSPTSKVWVYISFNSLDSNLKEKIKLSFNTFISSWKSHGNQVKAQMKFIKNNVLVVGAQHQGAHICGRAVDDQVRWVDRISKDCNVDLLNRNNIAFLFSDSLQIYDFKNIAELVNDGTISSSTLCINSFCTYNSDKLQLPFSESKLGSRYFS